MNPDLQPCWPTSALITIDTQVDTLDGGPFEVPGTQAALPAMARLAAAFRAAGRPIVHIVRIYLADGSNVDLCRRRQVRAGKGFLLAGTDGVQVAAGLLPDPTIRLDEKHLLAGRPQPVGPGEVILYKPRWGAFYQTCLEEHLRGQQVDTVVFCGCNFPNCPRASIIEASERDLRTVVAQDALSGLDGRGIRELSAMGVVVMTTDEIVAGLKDGDQR